MCPNKKREIADEEEDEDSDEEDMAIWIIDYWYGKGQCRSCGTSNGAKIKKAWLIMRYGVFSFFYIMEGGGRNGIIIKMNMIRSKLSIYALLFFLFSFFGWQLTFF